MVLSNIKGYVFVCVSVEGGEGKGQKSVYTYCLENAMHDS